MACNSTAYLTKPIKQAVLLQAIKDYSNATGPSSETAGEAPETLSRASRRLAERTPAYLLNCRRNVVEMGDALDRADFQAVSILGHNLRGSGGGFGFHALTDIGAGLEAAAGLSDNAASRKWVANLAGFLDSVGCPQLQ